MKRQHKHTNTYNGKRYTWDVTKLWELAKSLPISKKSLDEISVVNCNCWFQTAEAATVGSIGDHCIKALEADLTFPIILNVDGVVMDGAHRVLRCIIEKIRTIKVVQFEEMPLPDVIE